MKSFLYIIVFVAFNCFSSKLFSQQQSNILLPENVQMEILLDSTTTASFMNNVYMDIWERIWIKSNSALACIDFDSDSVQLNYFTLEGQPYLNDICWLNNGEMIIANDSALLLLDDAGYKEIYYLPYPNMKIAPADTNSLYLYAKSPIRKEYDISLLNLERKITRLFSLDEEITDIAGNGNITIVALKKVLLLFSKNVEPTVFYHTDSEIRSIAITDFGGIFIATQKGVIYFENMERAYSFCNVGAKKLWNINNKLYILFDDGKFAVIYPINQFKNLTQTEFLK